MNNPKEIQKYTIGFDPYKEEGEGSKGTNYGFKIVNGVVEVEHYREEK